MEDCWKSALWEGKELSVGQKKGVQLYDGGDIKAMRRHKLYALILNITINNTPNLAVYEILFI